MNLKVIFIILSLHFAMLETPSICKYVACTCSTIPTNHPAFCLISSKNGTHPSQKSLNPSFFVRTWPYILIHFGEASSIFKQKCPKSSTLIFIQISSTRLSSDWQVCNVPFYICCTAASSYTPLSLSLCSQSHAHPKDYSL